MPSRLEVKVGQEDQKGEGRRLEQKERDRRCSGDGRKVLFSDFLYVRYRCTGRKHSDFTCEWPQVLRNCLKFSRSQSL